jgi:type VI secretion system secreted protein Hcp
MEKVFITAVSTGATSGDDRLTENIILNFGKVSVDYTPQDEKGAAGTAIPFAWDIAANAKEG